MDFKAIRWLSAVLILFLFWTASAQANIIPKATETASLLIPKSAHINPVTNSQVIRQISDHTPIYGTPAVLPIINELNSSQGWLKVELWERPNGSTGWITSAGTRFGRDPWVVRVSLNSRLMKVYHFGHLTRTISVVVGSPMTPTPTGNFFIVEKVPQPSGSDIGPWALALNGYSNVLHQFGGGPGQIAIHGVGTLAGHPGEAASSGCLRVSTTSLYWLAHHLSAGTTVDITQGNTARIASFSTVIPSLFTENNMRSIFGEMFSPFYSTA